MRIGIDFGSTYSSISIFDNIRNELKAISIDRSDSIPSIASYDSRTDKYMCGTKNYVGKEGIKVFEGFKMLLAAGEREYDGQRGLDWSNIQAEERKVIEQERRMLDSRGYDSHFTPKKITCEYLKHIIRHCIKNTKNLYERKDKNAVIDEIVICVPEIWQDDEKQLLQESRQILKEILDDKNFLNEVSIKHVRTVTEPEAASTFFAYNYEQTSLNKDGFNGYILLIDYGGGTLDLTLTEVESNGEGKIEVCTMERGGAGDNHPEKGELGCAGIAYMQDVMKRVINRKYPEKFKNNGNIYDSSFFEAVNDLEMFLQNDSEEIVRWFKDGLYDTFEERCKGKDYNNDENEFTSIGYGKNGSVSVTYMDLFYSYKEVIEPILNKEIKEINDKIQKHIRKDPCKPNSGNDGRFKIAIVGGFSSLFFVKKQLALIYKIDSDEGKDPRISGYNMDEESRRLAISYGAALIADHKVNLRKIAPYSFGIAEMDRLNGRVKDFWYGIRYHQDIEVGTVYYICYGDDGTEQAGQPMTIENLQNAVFFIEYTDQLGRGRVMRPLPETMDKLKRLPENGVYNCGFSFDENDVLTIHCDVDKNAVSDWKKYLFDPIKFNKIRKMFDISNSREESV